MKETLTRYEYQPKNLAVLHVIVSHAYSPLFFFSRTIGHNVVKPILWPGPAVVQVLPGNMNGMSF